MKPSLSDADRGVSRALGVTLLVAIVLLLAVTAGITFFSLAEQGGEASQVHGMGAYEVNYEKDTGHLELRPESVQTRETTFYLYVNGQQAYEWDGASSLDIACLYPDDRMRIVTEKGSTTNLLKEYTLDRALKCDLGFTEQFKFVTIDGAKVPISSRYNFDLAIDPDGPGADDYAGISEHSPVGPIPLSNQWHYSKQFAGPIEGLGTGDKPVYLFIMADNVHWNNAPDWPGVANSGDLNWTDPVPDGRDPGADNYEIHGTDFEPHPNSLGPGDGEPTNDVYMLFEPGCDQSRLKIVYYQGGYDNSINMQGTEIVANTKNAAPTDPDDIDAAPIYTAPGIPCFEG